MTATETPKPSSTHETPQPERRMPKVRRAVIQSFFIAFLKLIGFSFVISQVAAEEQSKQDLLYISLLGFLKLTAWVLAIRVLLAARSAELGRIHGALRHIRWFFSCMAALVLLRTAFTIVVGMSDNTWSDQFLSQVLNVVLGLAFAAFLLNAVRAFTHALREINATVGNDADS